jgi:hypothetical protein
MQCTSNNLDLFLAGQMGAYVELCFPDGTRIRFVPAPSAAGHTNTYRQTGGSTGPFRNTTAEFDGKVWRVKRNDDWTLYFPYHPEWLGQYVTVLGSFAAPDGLEYKIERDMWARPCRLQLPPENGCTSRMMHSTELAASDLRSAARCNTSTIRAGG